MSDATLKPRSLLFMITISLGCGVHAESKQEVAPSAAVKQVPLDPATVTWNREQFGGQATRLSLPYDRQAALAGTWVQRDALWEDTALVFAKEGGELCVLEGGATSERRIWKRSEERGALLRDLTWSADGSTLYLWLDLEQQLCAIDTQSGRIQSFTDLGTHASSRNGLRFNRHLDPMPESRPGGVVIDDGRLILLMDEESNDEVALWDRRPGRGGCWLAAVDLRDHTLRALFDKSLMPAGARNWDLSLKRGHLFAVTMSPAGESGQPRRWIEQRQLDGTLVQAYGPTAGEIDALQLSPSQDQLLVEREYQPDLDRPSGDPKEMSRSDLQALVAAQHGGFLIIDLASGEATDGLRRGNEARWSPDSDRVAYVDGWAVSICSLSRRVLTPLIEGGAAEEDWYAGTWIEPVWSLDGARLAITGRALGLTLLLDLSRREYVVLDVKVTEKIWANSPRPFSAAAGRRRRARLRALHRSLHELQCRAGMAVAT